MAQNFVILKNEQLEAKILLDWDYRRSRYDWGGTVGQVTMQGHTFLSEERTPSGGVGLGGVGLTNVWEWQDTHLYDQTAIADFFPLPGVGLLKKTDTNPFLFTKDYPVTPFQHIIRSDPNQVSIRTLPHLCQGVAIDMEKQYHLEGNTLVVTFQVTNTGPEEIHATEFCHNFFRFDDQSIDSSYRLSFPYTICPEIRRGELIATRDTYRLGSFDGPTESTAFSLTGWQGLSSHWMKLENPALGMSVLIEDTVPICHFYSWNNFNAFCPEVFAPIDLKPGEKVMYMRKYTFEV